MHRITSVEQLAEHYPAASPQVYWKDLDYVSDHYATFIERSPFVILATQGEHGIDCSPRGDPAGFVRIANPHCLHLPDRRGNNRLDSLRNILQNPQVGLFFLVPGVGETLRVMGRANIVVDPELCQSFSINGQPASSVITVQVEKVLFQCQKALRRSNLWQVESWPDQQYLPTIGQMAQTLAARQGLKVDAARYDQSYLERVHANMY